MIKLDYLKNKFSIDWVQTGKVHSNLLIDVKEMPMVEEVEIKSKVEMQHQSLVGLARFYFKQ